MLCQFTGSETGTHAQVTACASFSGCCIWFGLLFSRCCMDNQDANSLNKYLSADSLKIRSAFDGYRSCSDLYRKHTFWTYLYCVIQHSGLCRQIRSLLFAGTLNEAVGVVAEKAVLKGGLVLPPGMLRGRHLGVLLLTAACLVLLPHLTMAVLLPHTATTPQPLTLGPPRSATDPLTDVSAMQVDSCERSSLPVINNAGPSGSAIPLRPICTCCTRSFSKTEVRAVSIVCRSRCDVLQLCLLQLLEG